GRGPNARRSGSQTHHARGHDGGPRDPISPTQRNLPRRFLSRVPHPGPGRRFAMTFTSARDGWLLFGTRFVRMFAYGFLSVALVLYLKAVGLAEGRIGLLLTLTLLGDVAISLWITTSADRVGRRGMLAIGAALMLAAAVVFAG